MTLGQEYLLKRYTVSDGLPSNTVYRIQQDSLGYIWLATENDLVRFDGTRFRSFSHPQLKNNQIISLILHHGKITFRTLINELGEVDVLRDSVYVPHFQGYQPEMRSVRDLTLVGDHELVSVKYVDSLLPPAMVSVFSCHRSPRRMCPLRGYGYRAIFYRQAQKQLLAVASTHFDYDTMVVAFLSRDHDSLVHQTNVFVSLSNTPSRNEPGSSWFAETSRALFLKFEKQLLFTIQDQQVTRVYLEGVQPEYQYFHLAEDGEHRLWLATSHGLFRLDMVNDSTYRLGTHLLPGVSVNFLHPDTEGNLWIATTGEGLYLLPADRYHVYGADTGGKRGYTVRKLTPISHSGIRALTWQGEMLTLSPERMICQSVLPPARYTGVSISQEGRTIAYGRGTTRAVKLPEKQTLTYELSGNRLPVRNIKSIAWWGEACWLGSNRYLGVWKQGETEIIHHSGRIQTIFVDRWRPQVWVGKEDVLAVVDTAHRMKTYLDATGASLPYWVTSIAQGQDSTLYIGTQGHGLWQIHHDTLRCLDEVYGLPGDSYQDLEYVCPYLWGATEQGIFKIDTRTGWYRMLPPTMISSLGEVYDLAYDDSLVYMSTTEGIVWFEPDQPRQLQVSPIIRFLSFEARNKSGEKRSDRELPSGFQQVLIQFAGLSYAEPLTYEYRTEDQAAWVEVEEPMLRFDFLPPGNYHLTIRAVRSNGLRSDQPIEVSFRIHPPLQQTWWFRSLVLLALMLASGSLVFYVVRQRARKARVASETEGKIASLRLHALRAQMNPHFIFNCLGLAPIQHLLLNNEGKTALGFLENLANMIRMAFEYAGWEYISLEEELHFLDTYIHLERQRLDQPLHVQVEVDPRLSPTVHHIPPMLIQPIVENAIQHGLLRKDEVGLLQIVIDHPDPQAEWLRCLITDNGIGRPAPHRRQETWRDKKRPSGLAITAQRLALIQQQTGKIASLKVHDLVDDQGMPCGTQVELWIPFEVIIDD